MAVPNNSYKQLHIVLPISHLVLVFYACLNLSLQACLHFVRKIKTGSCSSNSLCLNGSFWWGIGCTKSQWNSNSRPGPYGFLRKSVSILICGSYPFAWCGQPAPPPPKFSEISSELPMFKLKLYQFLMGNYDTYGDHESQLLFAGSLLEWSAGQ